MFGLAATYGSALSKHAGASRLMAPYSTMHAAAAISVDRLLADLRDVLELRDDVAHEKPTLDGDSVMFRRLGIAHSLANALTTEDK